METFIAFTLDQLSPIALREGMKETLGAAGLLGRRKEADAQCFTPVLHRQACEGVGSHRSFLTAETMQA